MYCEFNGMFKLLGLCVGGWYCIGGLWERMLFNISDIVNGFVVCFLIGEIGGFCKKGSFCSVGFYELLFCILGYYCEEDKLDMEFGVCVVGYFCNGSIIYSYFVNQSNGDRCLKGYYCFIKSFYLILCFLGIYVDIEFNQFRNNCKFCIVGIFCLIYGLDFLVGNCFEGFYCFVGEIQVSSLDKECQFGYFCFKGSGFYNSCFVGIYQLYVRKGFCYICFVGSYCDFNEVR